MRCNVRIVRPGGAITSVPVEAESISGVGVASELGTTGGSTFAAGEVLAVVDVVGLGIVDDTNDRAAGTIVAGFGTLVGLATTDDDFCEGWPNVSISHVGDFGSARQADRRPKGRGRRPQ